MSTGIHKALRVRIELDTVDATYEIELTAPDRIELGGLDQLVAELGIERDSMELPADGPGGWTKTIGLDSATVTLTAHGKLKAERRAR